MIRLNVKWAATTTRTIKIRKINPEGRLNIYV
jgi:hypothetical protein